MDRQQIEKLPTAGDFTSGICNMTLTNPNTEYEVALPPNCKVTMQCRTAFDVRFAFATGKVATPTSPYGTMKAGTGWSTPEDVLLSGETTTLYLASSQAGVVVELIAYQGAG